MVGAGRPGPSATTTEGDDIRQRPIHDGGASCELDEQGAARRTDEFAELARRGLRNRHRTGDGAVLLTFHRDGGLEDDLRDLVERESACCGFFTFDLRFDDDLLAMRVAAPDDKGDYLNALHRATEPDRTPDGTSTAPPTAADDDRAPRGSTGGC